MAACFGQYNAGEAADKEPLYVQVARSLRGRILRGELAVGQRLPTEGQMCEVYHVSRVTVRRALDELAREGLVERRRPLGTFVGDWEHASWEAGRYTVARGFTADLQERGLTACTMRASISLEVPDRKVASFLGLGLEEPAMVLRRVRGTRDEGTVRPFALFVTTFTPVEGLPPEGEGYHGSFYGLLRERGIVPRRVEECTEAVAPSPEVVEALGVRRSQPILKRTIHTRQEGGAFREHSECFYVGSEYRYCIRFEQKQDEGEDPFVLS